MYHGTPFYSKGAGYQPRFPTPPWRQDFPKHWRKHFTPSELLGKGFNKCDRPGFAKAFSNVLDLVLVESRGYPSAIFYEWELNEKNLQGMIDELAVINMRLDDKAKELWAYDIGLFGDGKHRKGGDGGALFHKKFLEVGETLYPMKLDFLKKYGDFIAMSIGVEIEPPYFRDQYFFFDGCHTMKQLDLFFKFIRLFLRAFGAVAKTKRYLSKIDPKSIRNSIEGYYVMLLTVRKIRKLYTRGATLDELKTRFPMASEEFLNNVTLDARDKKGWAFRASDFAVKHASCICKTTPSNFRQMLKKDSPFAREAMQRVSRIEEVEKVLEGKLPIQTPAEEMLMIDNITEEHWVESLRSRLSTFGPSPGDSLRLPKR